MEDKNNLTRKDCFEINKWDVNDNIYSIAKIEGSNITFPQTIEISKGRTVIRNINEDVISENIFIYKQKNDLKWF